MLTTFLQILKLFWLKIVLGVIVLVTVIWAYRSYNSNTPTVADQRPAVQTSPAPSPIASPSPTPEPSPLASDTSHAVDTKKPGDLSEPFQQRLEKARQSLLAISFTTMMLDETASKDPIIQDIARIAGDNIKKNAELEGKLAAARAREEQLSKPQSSTFYLEGTVKVETRAHQHQVMSAPPPPPPQPTPPPAPTHPCVSYRGTSKSECLTTLRNQQKWGG